MDVDDRQRHQTLWTCYRSLDLGFLPFLPFLEILNEKERKKEKREDGKWFFVCIRSRERDCRGGKEL